MRLVLTFKTTDMTKAEFQKLIGKLEHKSCPICNGHIIDIMRGEEDIAGLDNLNVTNYKDILIPNSKYWHLECRFCGYVMNFNIDKLLR